MGEKILVLFRGLPGSGKSTLASRLFQHCASADDYFYNVFGEYNFDIKDIGKAHESCKNKVENYMKDGVPAIAVHNTFTADWEIKPYDDLCKEWGYQLHTLIVENRHGSANVHGCPEDVIDKMKNRFSIKL